ncbi:hypothetical protein OUZ56_010355 [Daphnia magna]|uniref:Uncharacterized protein n=1 Tax=Daphnia magna TaxID=35525 RepID=A0ABR0AIC1_9CRUS|nr:hypothetical protein OUZ56_010355 [Daphnia magna]
MAVFGGSYELDYKTVAIQCFTDLVSWVKEDVEDRVSELIIRDFATNFMKVEFVREIDPLKVESSMEEYFLANEDIYLGRRRSTFHKNVCRRLRESVTDPEIQRTGEKLSVLTCRSAFSLFSQCRTAMPLAVIRQRPWKSHSVESGSTSLSGHFLPVNVYVIVNGVGAAVLNVMLEIGVRFQMR